MRSPTDPIPAALSVVFVIVVAVIALLSLAAPAQGAPSRTDGAAATTTAATAAQEAALAEFRATQPGNAVAAAVLHDGEVSFVAAGTDETGAPVTERTPFRIASMSKSFTAALVLQLADEGRLDLDAPLSESLPAFAMSDERAGRITLRHLLSHTSGIGAEGYAEFELPPPRDADELLGEVRTATLVAEPGTRYEYANTNFALAAAVVEHITGQPLADGLEQRLFTPLAMGDSASTVACEAPVDGLGTGHGVVFDRPVPMAEVPGLCLGSGGVVSTAADLSRWLDFQAGDGRTADGAQLLRPESLAELHRVQAATEGASGGGYALGWQRGEAGGRPTLGHGGALVTWSSHMTMLVDGSGRPDGTASVVLTDTVSGANVLADRLAVEAEGGAVAPFEGDVRLLVDIVVSVLAVGVAGLGVLGVVRARSWPERRRRPWTRAGGLVWPAAVAALGVGLAPVLAAGFFGVSMGFVTSWWYTAGMMPLVAALGVVLVLAGAALLGARIANLWRRARRDAAVAR